jgi:hypothetical protein
MICLFINPGDITDSPGSRTYKFVKAYEQFSRVLSWIGSFTGIPWKEGSANSDGGQDYLEKVLREPKRSIRVWLQDGSEDMENDR